MKIVVASKNPVKIKATKSAFKKVFPNKDLKVVGVEVPSRVSDQPIGKNETLKGAMNRVFNASKEVNADFYVGIEGGVNKKRDIETAWIVVKDNKGNVSKSHTSPFILPEKITALLQEGKALGDATDTFFKSKNSKQTTGLVGILTKGVIDRERYYIKPIILALIPFVNDKLYFEK